MVREFYTTSLVVRVNSAAQAIYSYGSISLSRFAAGNKLSGAETRTRFSVLHMYRYDIYKA